MRVVLFAIVIMLPCLRVNGQHADSVVAEVTWQQILEKVSTGRAYTLVILKEGPSREQLPKDEMEKQQKAHLTYLFTLKAQGKLPLFGPCTGSQAIRGICIFNVTDEAEVRRLIDKDPNVQSGRLTYEVHPWFGIPGDQLPEK